jgi:hypothetical protein
MRSIKQRLRTLLLCLPHLMGAFIGAPMRPEQIEELMHSMKQQKIACTVSQEGENCDDTIPQQIDGEP